MTRRDEFAVVVAGGGVAALEAALALRELGEGRVRVELLAPEPSFWYRPVAVAEPFGLGEVRHFDLGRLADAAGAGLTLGALAGVDSERREARTEAGGTLAYDALLIACGAVPKPAIPGALTFRGPADTEKLSDLLDEIERGDVRHVAFAAPWGAGWVLPLYELALMTAARLAARDVRGVELTLVTPEDAPLQLFGRDASMTVTGLLDEAGISVVTNGYAAGVQAGELVLTPEGSVPAERVVALPRLYGQRIDGIPQTVDGFVQTDDHGCVFGTEMVFAAGDITSFPVKQGGIAAQQAEVAAESILAWAGIELAPRRFEPVLRGLLLTGSGPRYLRHELDAKATRPDAVSEAPLWWPPTKIVGRRLAPFLASLTGEEVVPDEPPPTEAVPVEVELDDLELDALATARLDFSDTATATGEGESATTVADVMSHEPLLAPSHVTLDVLAKQMRERDTGSALVVDEGELVGIVTARDLLRAVATGIDAREIYVRQWMTAEPIVAPADTTLPAAAALMNGYGIHHLPVVEGKRVLGMIGLRDAVRPRLGTSTPAVGLGF